MFVEATANKKKVEQLYQKEEIVCYVDKVVHPVVKGVIRFLNECSNCFQNDFMSSPKEKFFAYWISSCLRSSAESLPASPLFNLPQPGKSGWSHKTINVFITSQ